MPDLNALLSGGYAQTDPYSPEPMGAPQYFKGRAGDATTLVPKSILSPESMGAPQRFIRSRSTAGAAAYPRFKRGPLGSYETEETISMLKPSEKGLPPQKRTRSRAEQISDIVGGLVYGAGDEAMNIAALPRTLADLGEGYIPQHMINRLPSRAEIGSAARGLGPYVPMSPEALSQITQGPQTPGGEAAAAVGGFGPYMGMGAISALRRLVAPVLGTQAVLP